MIKIILGAVIGAIATIAAEVFTVWVLIIKSK
jgi:hypothetical protein